MFDENEYTVVGLSDEELHTAFLSKEYKPFSNQDIVFKEYYDRDGMKTILGRILFGKSYNSEDIYNFLNKFSPSFAEKYKMTLNYVDPVEQKLNYKCKKEDSPDGMSNKCNDNKVLSEEDSKVRVSKKSITMDDKKSSSAYVPSKNVKDAEKFAYDNIIDQKSRKHAEEWNSGSIAHTTPDKVQQIKLVSYRGLDIHVSNIINKQLIENSLLNLPRPTSIIATQLRKEPNTLMRIGSSGKLEINTIAVGNFKKIDTSLDAGRKLNGKVGQDAMKFLGEHVATMTEKQKRQYEDIKECMKYSRACVGYEDDSNPERALTATINHEIAHMLDRYGKYGYDTPQHEEFKQIKRDMINTTLNSDYKYKLSSYGCKESGIFRQINKEETWAELYSAYRFHEDENIHPDVLRLLKKYLPER